MLRTDLLTFQLIKVSIVSNVSIESNACISIIIKKKTFGVTGAVFKIAGEVCRLPAYFDNPGKGVHT